MNLIAIFTAVERKKHWIKAGNIRMLSTSKTAGGFPVWRY